MAQDKTQLRTTGVYPGNIHIQELNAAINSLSTGYLGPVDPTTIQNIVVLPGFVWADTSDPMDPVVKKRNETDDGWIVTGGLWVPSIDAWAVAPTVDLGRPIHIIGEGPAEWNPTVGAYVPIGGGAKGGGADKIFYLNDQIITEDYTVVAGQSARTTGPVRVLTGVTVAVETGAVWKVD